MRRADTHDWTSEDWSRWLTSEMAQPRSSAAPRAGPQSLFLARGGSMILPRDRERMLVILRGAGKLIAHVGPDREQILSFHFSNDWVNLPAGGSHQIEFVSIADCEIRSLEGPHFAELGQRNPALVPFVLNQTTRSLQRSREKAVALGRKTASERVADFLIGMARRIGTRDQGHIVISLPMSRRDIADSLGLTIETVSRQLGCLRTAGIIETSGRSSVKIIDPDLLEANSGRSASV